MPSIIIDATPQKRLFLSIIADYGLITSICELIDNALDQWLVSGKAEPLEIRVILNSDRQQVRVTDNAGGVPSDSLELLVSPGASRENDGIELIGNFGVGGKRAGIALGERVEVRTRHANGQTYSLVLDQDWLNAESDWDLTATEVNDIAAGSTEVHISQLRQGISLEDIKLLERLVGEIYANFLSPECNLRINDTQVLVSKFDNWSFPPKYLPKSASFTIHPTEDRDQAVSVRITAGLISDRDPVEGNYGVYFYCNDRLILAHEKGAEVGYFKGKAGTPHPDASLCRVIVELNGKPELMPWNSNKAGINWSHPTFEAIRDKIIEFTEYYTTISRRTKNDREAEIFQFDKGDIQEVELDAQKSLKQVVELPTPRGRKKAFADLVVDQNRSITESSPWTLGLVEAMSAIEVISSRRKLETRNRMALVLLDSNFEIALKEFLVHLDSVYFSDQEIAKLFNSRHLVITEVKKHSNIDQKYWKKAQHYNNLRNKLIHERATVQILDREIDDYREVVSHVLNELFGLSFTRA